MQHVTSLHIREGFLSSEECSILIKLIQAYSRREKGCKPTCCTDKRTEVAARDVFAQGFPQEAELLQRTRDRCCAEVENELHPKAAVYPTFMLLAGNYLGDCHRRHADNCKYDAATGNWVPNHTPDRVVSCGIYLNAWDTDFGGGELLFPGLNKTIKPSPGLLVAFPSDERFEHEVPAVTRGSRYSIFMWFTENRRHAERSLTPTIKRVGS